MRQVFVIKVVTAFALPVCLFLATGTDLLGAVPPTETPPVCAGSNTCRPADQTPGADQADSAPLSPVEQLLDRLEHRGKKLRSLQADFLYQRTQGLLGDVQVRTGKLAYARQPERRPAQRFSIHFEKRIVGNALRDDPQQFIFDGAWLVEKNFANKVCIKRQVVPPGRDFDPLAIGQGPFPMPLGQERQKVVQLFNVTRIDPDKGLDAKLRAKLPAHLIRLQLIPKIDPQTHKPVVEFTRIDLWYDADSLLPALVRTADDSENQTEVRLTNLRIDQLDDQAIAQRFNTDTPPAGAGWHVEIKPWSQESSPSAPAPKKE